VNDEVEEQTKTDILVQLNDLIGERDQLREELHDVKAGFVAEIVEKRKTIKKLRKRLYRLQTFVLKIKGMEPEEFHEVKRLLRE